ncbi:MAG TPA: protein translocase subunit SecD, partial [Burkholderiales bacterium]|nr:protein translocase subunit SecD [Burkholderiales bacterium]
MNRYPTWGYALIALAVIAAFLYTLPNFFGESPAVQISSGRSTVKLDAPVMARAEEILTKENIPYTGAVLDATSMRVRFADTDTQLKARDVLDRALNPDPKNPSYIVALNLLPASPNWLTAIRALPMYLGLDLRGGVHFLLQVDMQAAIVKRLESLAADARSQLRDRSIRHGGITREAQTLRVRFRDTGTRDKARAVLLDAFPDFVITEREDGQDLLLVAALKPEAVRRTQDYALKQNIT